MYSIKNMYVLVVATCMISSVNYFSMYGMSGNHATVTYGLPTATNQTVTVVSHGLGACKEHAWYYHAQSGSRNAFIEGQIYAFDFGDVHNVQSTCLGQGADIARLHSHVQHYQDCSLFGWSRGAVTIANYAGSMNIKNVGDIVLESPFHDIKGVVLQKTCFESVASLIPFIFRNHDPQGIQPSKVAHLVDKNIPILIICSKQDTLIPACSSIEYYHALRASGHQKAYVLVVDRGAHANIVNGADGHIVRNVIHAFKQAHNRPHNAEWAAAGRARYAQCQP